MNKLLIFAALAAAGSAAQADNLYSDPNWPAMTADRHAAAVGDILTVNIFQAAEATNSAQNNSRKSTDLSGSIEGGHLSESGEIQFGGGYSGRGEVKRSERFVSQMSVSVLEVLPNGDLIVGGDQYLFINGEKSKIGVRGRVRVADIRSDNSILSTRIADAQIDYNGRGFVSRSSKPGLVSRLFSFLGLI